MAARRHHRRTSCYFAIVGLTNHIGDRSVWWQSTRRRQIGDRCQSVWWQS